MYAYMIIYIYIYVLSSGHTEHVPSFKYPEHVLSFVHTEQAERLCVGGSVRCHAWCATPRQLWNQGIFAQPSYLYTNLINNIIKHLTRGHKYTKNTKFTKMQNMNYAICINNKINI